MVAFCVIVDKLVNGIIFWCLQCNTQENWQLNIIRKQQ